MRSGQGSGPSGSLPCFWVPGERDELSDRSILDALAALQPVLPCQQHVSCLRALAGANDPPLLHEVHEPARAGEAHLQPSLEHGGGAELGSDDQLDGLLQELIVVAAVELVIGRRRAQTGDIRDELGDTSR